MPLRSSSHASETTIEFRGCPVSGLPGRHEETVNLLTHGLGLVLAIAGSIGLLRSVILEPGGTGSWRFVACGLYAATLVALYASSTLSHTFGRPRLRQFFRMADQACIFLLIAGSFTPFAMAYLVDAGWWGLLIAMWVLALAGIVFKVFFRYGRNVSVWAYLLLSLLPLIAFKTIVSELPMAVLAWVVAGGLAYTVGTLFLSRDERVPYFHAVWHLLVIAGSAFHFIAISASVSGAG